MKKIISVFLMMFIFAGASVAGTNKADDLVTGDRYSQCNRNKNVGYKAFCRDGFPYIRICRDTGARYSFSDCGEDTVLCPGYVYSNYNSSTSEPVPDYKEDDHKNKCWKWKCRNGYVPDNKNRCISVAECASNPNCDTAASICSEIRSGFKPEYHEAVPGANCNTFKCKSGMCGDTAALSGGTCKPTAAAGTFGGTYGDAAGVCKPCAISEYVNDTWDGCARGVSVGRTQMRECFESADFAACIKGASGTPDNSNNNTPESDIARYCDNSPLIDRYDAERGICVCKNGGMWAQETIPVRWPRFGTYTFTGGCACQRGATLVNGRCECVAPLTKRWPGGGSMTESGDVIRSNPHNWNFVCEDLAGDQIVTREFSDGTKTTMNYTEMYGDSR